MNTIEVAHKSIGPGSPCFLVAEIGINHNGDMDLAMRAIDAAKAAGADSVKFQNYYTDDFVFDRELTYEYISQGKTVRETQYEMFKRHELDEAELATLKRHCDAAGVVFHSTPTSTRGIQILEDLNVPFYKNGSDFLTNLDVITEMGETGKPTILSTGMSTLAEIDDAVRAFRQTGNEQVILLHCTSSYPTPATEVNLRRMKSLTDAFGCLVGFSDHTDGVTAAVAAVALGAHVIEKHFTLDRDLPGPDHRFSSDPAEFKQLTEAVRYAEQALGNSHVGPTETEEAGRVSFRLSCVAARDLDAGTRLSETDIVYSRPGSGIAPKHKSLLIGRSLQRSVHRGELLINDAME